MLAPQWLTEVKWRWPISRTIEMEHMWLLRFHTEEHGFPWNGASTKAILAVTNRWTPPIQRERVRYIHASVLLIQTRERRRPSYWITYGVRAKSPSNHRVKSRCQRRWCTHPSCKSRKNVLRQLLFPFQITVHILSSSTNSQHRCLLQGMYRISKCRSLCPLVTQFVHCKTDRFTLRLQNWKKKLS